MYHDWLSNDKTYIQTLETRRASNSKLPLRSLWKHWRVAPVAGPFQLFTFFSPSMMGNYCTHNVNTMVLVRPFAREGFANTEARVHLAAFHTGPWCWSAVGGGRGDCVWLLITSWHFAYAGTTTHARLWQLTLINSASPHPWEAGTYRSKYMIASVLSGDCFCFHSRNLCRTSSASPFVSILFSSDQISTDFNITVIFSWENI